MSKRTKRTALGIALVNLTLVGVVGYALEGRKEIVGTLFLTPAGPVAFKHQLHVRHGGPDLDCKACHHDLLAGESTEKNCRACHYYGDDPFRAEAEKDHKRCIGAKCVSCHATKDCAFCHNP